MNKIEKLKINKFGKLTVVLIIDSKNRFYENKSIENKVHAI